MILSLLIAGAAIDRSPAGARAVVERYYHAIEHRRFRDAYRCWNGASGQSFAAFARGFAATAHSRVTAGRPFDGEGAAGSLFVSVPVRVTATARDGTVRRYRGSYTLRRVNDVDGATPAQLRWHLAAASLRRS